jgi:hypothetical protein
MRMFGYTCIEGHVTEELYLTTEVVPETIQCKKCGGLAEKDAINKLVPVRMPMSQNTFSQGH